MDWPGAEVEAERPIRKLLHHPRNMVAQNMLHPNFSRGKQRKKKNDFGYNSEVEVMVILVDCIWNEEN